MEKCVGQLVTFKKLSNRWYCDIPYNGDVSDLEMVFGADTLLDTMSFSKHPDIREVEVFIDSVPHSYDYKLSKFEPEFDLQEGSMYKVTTFEEFSGDIWICDVTKLVLGGFPEIIFLIVK